MVSKNSPRLFVWAGMGNGVIVLSFRQFLSAYQLVEKLQPMEYQWGPPTVSNSMGDGDGDDVGARDDEIIANAIKVQQCRERLERLLNGNNQSDDIGLINTWLLEDVPLFDQIWYLNGNSSVQEASQQSRPPHYMVLMSIIHVGRSKDKWLAVLNGKWIWEDQFGVARPATNLWGGLNRPDDMMLLLRLDVPPTNSMSTASENAINEIAVPVAMLPLVLNESTKDSTPRYNMTPWLECDALERKLARPPPDVKIGACLRFRGSHHAVRQWIAYHRMIGIQQFWIFLNEAFDISDFPVVKDVTYVPYNFVWPEHKNYTRHSHRRSGNSSWQVMKDRHCLYRAKQYGMDWIVNHDVIEYIWISDPKSRNATNPIAHFLTKRANERIRRTNKGSVMLMKSVPMGRNRIVEPENKTFELVIDYTYRRNLINITWDRAKGFFRVNEVELIGIHKIIMPTADLTRKTRRLEVRIGINLYHYKTSHDKVFQSTKEDVMIHNTGIRDKNHNLITQRLHDQLSWGSMLGGRSVSDITHRPKKLGSSIPSSSSLFVIVDLIVQHVFCSIRHFYTTTYYRYFERKSLHTS